MRFLADMGVSIKVVEWLRGEGHDVSHLNEEGLHRMPDEEIFGKAVLEKRTILTFDLDFGEIVALSKGRQTSVVTFRLRNTRIPNVIKRLAAVLKDATGALEEGAVVIVEEWRHRIRRLPIHA